MEILKPEIGYMGYLIILIALVLFYFRKKIFIQKGIKNLISKIKYSHYNIIILGSLLLSFYLIWKLKNNNDINVQNLENRIVELQNLSESRKLQIEKMSIDSLPSSNFSTIGIETEELDSNILKKYNYKNISKTNHIFIAFEIYYVTGGEHFRYILSDIINIKSGSESECYKISDEFEKQLNFEITKGIIRKCQIVNRNILCFSNFADASKIKSKFLTDNFADE